ncbi:hypothetical protein [Flavobacterium stagni]|uniref:Mis12-Mtw1 protein family n=1 Tax=Flavobacterium stagni TaxID=2506421 RepID=A0A4Q1K8H6_9FLAO|nr:hypothetical protein [Flavobacterium stagni]RXR22491.1 hypothetical protein EQG61_07860 [Flavobacterium stagni]
MSEITEIIDALEKKVQKLFAKIDDLELKNQALQQQLKVSVEEIQQHKSAKENIVKDFEALKMTNALLGSDEYKRDTKLKINALIREIDYCIAQLAD